MPEGVDRREARRFLMSLPMRVLPREADTKELHASTRDVSYRGLYFMSETTFEVGGPIEFILTLPQQVSSSGEVDIRCRGQIVRVEASSNGRLGVAAKIDRYEFLPVSASAA
jgi:PilZ domain